MLMQRNKTPKLFEARRSVTISSNPKTIIINFQLRGKMFWEEEENKLFLYDETSITWLETCINFHIL